MEWVKRMFNPKNKIRIGHRADGHKYLDIDELNWFEDQYLSLRLRLKYSFSIKGGAIALEPARYIRGSLVLNLSGDEVGNDLQLYSDSEEGDEFLQKFFEEL
jgi:hypothetical protein